MHRFLVLASLVCMATFAAVASGQDGGRKVRVAGALGMQPTKATFRRSVRADLAAFSERKMHVTFSRCVRDEGGYRVRCTARVRGDRIDAAVKLMMRRSSITGDDLYYARLLSPPAAR